MTFTVQKFISLDFKQASKKKIGLINFTKTLIIILSLQENERYQKTVGGANLRWNQLNFDDNNITDSS